MQHIGHVQNFKIRPEDFFLFFFVLFYELLYLLYLYFWCRSRFFQEPSWRILILDSSKKRKNENQEKKEKYALPHGTCIHNFCISFLVCVLCVFFFFNFILLHKSKIGSGMVLLLLYFLSAIQLYLHTSMYYNMCYCVRVCVCVQCACVRGTYTGHSNERKRCLIFSCRHRKYANVILF